MVAIVVHGGAARVPTSVVEPKLRDLRIAARKGFFELLLKRSENTAALDAVEQAVLFMEDSPLFNAGFGSSLTSTGHVEMDAIIVDGKTINFGAVASVTDFPNPISLSRKILECSEHCLFTREGAHQFALEHGFKPLDGSSELVSNFAKIRLAQYQTFQNAIAVDKPRPLATFGSVKEKDPKDHDTVGSVAIDWFGNFAAATSTGGITGKRPGRIGDSPIIGSGAYADNNIGAVSSTGHGESIMRVCLARHVLYRYEQLLKNPSPNPEINPMQQAVEESIEMMRERISGYGGVIAIGTGHGDIGVSFSTEAMPWAYITSDDNDMALIDQQLKLNPTATDSIKLMIHCGYHYGNHIKIKE